MIDARLALGVAPNTLESWRRQQSRWSSGTFDVARRIFPRVWRSLNWHQRVDYSLCITWYLSGLFSFVLYLFPIFTAVGVKFFSYNSISEFLAFTLSMIAVTWVLTDYPTYAESKSLRKTVTARAVSLAVSDVYLKALVSALRKRNLVFEVTRKGDREQPRMLSALRALKFHLILLGIGAAAAFYSLAVDRSLDAIANAGWIWNNNMWVVLSALSLGRK
jgi:cellulose synthase (UDP-forming)